ncbi:nucleotidyltransferase domain-containing protein [Agrococcus sp. KRD186]|uniref:nucleotidyltransferase domain-containing protein n=1 Tax=Agrococcus sp. KRD186 TaxID=2729730 RepID=UPI0019D103F1|nr:amino acid transporter [Agrococcus sp. KRD186]
MQPDDVALALDAIGEPVWIAGGWGVDALVGRQTREHRDLDVLVPAARLEAALAALAELGCEVETDWLPVRVEVAGARLRVDLHPVIERSDALVQRVLDGELCYPIERLTTGLIGDRPVRCIDVELQRELHSGYEPRAADVHDLARLDEIGSRS